ncbi:hypothetical protein O3G_MSEX014868 [Manduca sexta]|uniref:DUF4200 domain-containing protein n=1 Tax=Manduca sexta TaxID=7130 RepID=A0A921ZWT9_MANSE|nr:hypothetical protein O3G_MSEX014868 [Manduca sexta]KAG6464997.1 hypothetical protein O3G_MSEX014868 [Manduca sexta]
MGFLSINICLSIRKYPVWDIARPTPQILMEQARRDLMEAEEKLTEKREEEKKNRLVMDAKWAELRNKEMLLKESFISFNKFIRENQEKRDRAERKMEADNEVLVRKTRETEAMRQRVAEMEEVRVLMEKQVKDYTIYEWRYDKVRNRVIKWELALNRLKETASRRHVELSHVRAAIWSLYVKICNQKGLPLEAPVADFEQQLVVIMRALLELRRIYRIAQRRSKEKDAESSQTA